MGIERIFMICKELLSLPFPPALPERLPGAQFTPNGLFIDAYALVENSLVFLISIQCVYFRIFQL
jgi:hypothetical protein